MAIFHLNCSSGSRQGGQSAVAKLMYIRREGSYACGRDDVLLTGFGNLPDWCDGGPARLFAATDRYERSNGRLYLEMEGALPIELDDDQQVHLVETFMAEVAPDLPYVWVIHEGRPPAAGVPRNRHFHCMVSERINDGISRDPQQWFRRANPRNPAAGGAPKDRGVKAHGWVDETRRVWERHVNEKLEHAGSPARVTADSHRDRIAGAEAAGDHETAEYLLLHPPGRHIGPTASAIERGGPGRPGRPTERGELARASAAEADRLRAGFESLESEMKAHGLAAVEAARDARVEEALVVAVQSGNPDDIIALDDATETKRQQIRDAALAVGLSQGAIECHRREAIPENPELGWGAVSDATEPRRQRKDAVDWAAAKVGLDDIDGVWAAAHARGEDPLERLEQATRTCAARSVLLDADAMEGIWRDAESIEAGSGWPAVFGAIEERAELKRVLESTADSIGLDCKTVYEVWRTKADPLHALEGVISTEARIIVEDARQTWLSREKIDRLHDEAEVGSGLGVLRKVTAERRLRMDEAELSAQNLGLDLSAVWGSVQDRDDPLEFFEREVSRRQQEIVAAAQAVFLDDEEVARVRNEAGLKDPGSGWRAVVDATAERRRRKDAVELAARAVTLDQDDIDRHYADAQTLGEDPLARLEQATSTQEAEFRAAAQAVHLGAEAVAHIRGEAELKDPGSGWRAVKEVTASRGRRMEEAETNARGVGLDPESIYAVAAAERKEDPLEALDRREVGTDHQVTLSQIDAALRRAEAIVRDRWPAPLTQGDQARLARYYADEDLPITTPYPGNSSYRPPACGDRTLGTAEAAAASRRDTETIAEIRSRNSYTASARDESEKVYVRKKGLEPEEMRDLVIETVENAWRKVDEMDLLTANYELARLDSSHRYDGGRSTIPPLSSIARSAKSRASTRADARTDHERNRGGRGGRGGR